MSESALQLWHGVLFRQRADLTFESISRHVAEWTGLEPSRALEAVHPADRAKVDAEQAAFRLRHARTWRITWVEQRRRQTTTGYEGYWENITERVQRDQELAQAHWKDTLSTATRRLVHDFNNLLTGVLSLSDAYLVKVRADNPAREGLQLINQSARQAADIVQAIGGMFREAPGRRAYENLAQLAAGATDMLRRVIEKHSSVKLEARQESIPVYVDAAELKQVIVSLGLALTPPITLEVGLDKKDASLRISGGASERCQAVLAAEAFARRNDATFVAGDKGYSFHFREADFSEADRRARSILLVADDGDESFRVAEFFRRNSYEVVIGAKDLIRSPDYRFDAIVKLPERGDSLLPDADVVFRRGMSEKEMLKELGDMFDA